MLTTAELRDMRQTMTASFPSIGTVYSNSPSGDSAAGQLQNYGTAAGTVHCRVSIPQRQQEIEIGGQIRSVSPTMIYCDYDGNVNDLQRIIIGGVTYEIIGIDNARSEPGCQVLNCAVIR